jgi:soluble lytic murein transglycosylase-like protein
MTIELDNSLRKLPAMDPPAGVADSRYSATQLKKLKKAAQDFEAIIITQMLKNMRRSMPESQLFGNGFAGDMYQSMFDETMAETMAGKGVFQLSDNILRSFGVNDDAAVTSSGQTLDDYRLHSIKVRGQNVDPFDWDRSIISEAGELHDVDPKLIEAVIKVESGFRSNAVSSAGATGLMQLMRDTADELGVRDRMSARENIMAGTRYLKGLLQRFDDDLELALAAYNAGPTTVQKYQGIPPYPETQRYVNKVMEHYKADM